LAGLERPDFRTICRFRQANLTVLEGLFVQVIAIAREMGMLHLGLVALDGTKIRANAGVASFKKSEAWQASLEQARQEVRRILEAAEAEDEADDQEYGPDRSGRELPDELKDARARVERLEQVVKRVQEAGQPGLRVSSTDTEARWMHTQSGSMPAFNAQIAVTPDQLIVHADVTGEPIDTNQVAPAITGIKQNTGEAPEKLAADAGYKSGPNLRLLEAEGIDGYLPDCEEKNIGKTRGNHPELYGREAFRYDAAQDCYICPAGQTMWPKTIQRRKTKYGGGVATVYQAPRGICRQCLKRDCCTTVRTKAGRTITRDDYEAERQRMRQKLSSTAGRSIYGRRKCLVEPVIGQMKTAMRLLQFLLRGLAGARIEWKWATIAYNLRKIIKWRQQGLLEATEVS